jgi:hypothetical protein
MRRHEHRFACGFDGAHYDDRSLPDAVLSLGPRWQRLLASADPQLRVRPTPDVWSAIEYEAHTRDVIALHAFGVEQALTRVEPIYPPIEERLADAAAETYGTADAGVVAYQIERDARRLAQQAHDATALAWPRRLTIGDHRSDVRQLLEHALHDALHHLDDVERGLAKLRTANR